jgi:FkbM family methyltransferase
MSNFRKALEKKLLDSRYNNFGIENFDEYRFGKYPHANEKPLNRAELFKRRISKYIGYNKKRFISTYEDFLLTYGEGLQKLYENIDWADRGLLIDLIAYRLLGYKKVKLIRNNDEYWSSIKKTDYLVNNNDSYNPHFLHFILQKYDLRKIGYDIQIYFTSPGVAIGFIFEQYAYKSGGKNIVEVEKGDFVLDLGACWGDTALYFTQKAGETGKVFSFEFISENLEVFNLNTNLNPKLLKQIELIRQPVSEKSDQIIYYSDNGPSARIEKEPFTGYRGQAATISIDDFINRNHITKVDFIKMDIEGSEPLALKGAIETIKRFKPKLAIAIYHSMEDFINIPAWISSLNLGYRLYLSHFTIHTEETIIFAKIEK